MKFTDPPFWGIREGGIRTFPEPGGGGRGLRVREEVLRQVLDGVLGLLLAGGLEAGVQIVPSVERDVLWTS